MSVRHRADVKISRRMLRTFCVRPNLLGVNTRNISRRVEYGTQGEFTMHLLGLSLRTARVIFRIRYRLQRSKLIRGRGSTTTVRRHFRFHKHSNFCCAPRHYAGNVYRKGVTSATFYFQQYSGMKLFDHPTGLPPSVSAIPFGISVYSYRTVRLARARTNSRGGSSVVVVITTVILGRLRVFLLLFSNRNVTRVDILQRGIQRLRLG